MPNILYFAFSSFIALFLSGPLDRMLNIDRELSLFLITLVLFSSLSAIGNGKRAPISSVIESSLSFLIVNIMTFGYLSNILTMTFVHSGNNSFPIELIPLDTSTIFIMSTSLLLSTLYAFFVRYCLDFQCEISMARILVLSLTSFALVNIHMYFFCNISFLSYKDILEIFISQISDDISTYDSISNLEKDIVLYFIIATFSVFGIIALHKKTYHNNNLSKRIQ